MWNEDRYEWVRMPTWWVQGHAGNGLLHEFGVRDKGISIASLMIYIMFCARANQMPTEEFTVGTARVTYDDISNATGLSRSMISKGISKLADLELIIVVSYRKQNVYKIVSHGNKPWAKLPKKHLYNNVQKGEISVFLNDFHIRSKNELNALKLYYLLLAYRDNDSNVTYISYGLISEYSGIIKREIRKAISFLINHNFIQLDKVLRQGSEVRANRYEIRGLTHLHAGNKR